MAIIRLTRYQSPVDSNMHSSGKAFCGPSPYYPNRFTIDFLDDVRGGSFDPSQSRQLRDEINNFLGENQTCPRCAANEPILRENERLRSGHAALTKQNTIIVQDNAFLERECQRLEAENETLRQRVASLEQDNANLSRTMATPVPSRLFFVHSVLGDTNLSDRTKLAILSQLAISGHDTE